MDYQRPGVAEDYRRTRHLPPETLAFWHDLVRECVLPEGIARVVDVGCARSLMATNSSASFRKAAHSMTGGCRPEHRWLNTSAVAGSQAPCSERWCSGCRRDPPPTWSACGSAFSLRSARFRTMCSVDISCTSRRTANRCRLIVSSGNRWTSLSSAGATRRRALRKPSRVRAPRAPG